MKKFPPKRILVPVDFSAPSLSALETAKRLARRFRAMLELVYVQDLPLSLSGFAAAGEAAGTPALFKQMNEFLRWQEERLRREAAGFPPSRVKVRTLRNSPAAGLADLARGGASDLVVMGTHGYAGLDRALFGSVAEAVVRRAHVPVLAVHGARRQPKFSRILVPHNLKPYADAALLYALLLARSTRSRVSVLYAAPKGVWEEDAKDELRRHLTSLLGASAARRLDLRVRTGDPRAAILDEALQGGFNLIALSAHRRPFLRDIVVGSTVERILRHSSTAVLAVPSGARR